MVWAARDLWVVVAEGFGRVWEAMVAVMKGKDFSEYEKVENHQNIKSNQT